MKTHIIGLFLLLISVNVNSQVLQERVGYLPYQQVINHQELKCMTDNIYFEGKNEKDKGKQAIALVTMNRIHKDEYPDTICQVVYQKKNGNCQFSWTCMNKSYKKVTDQELYNHCESIARMIILNYKYTKDFTSGATNFHRNDIRPHWAKKTKRTAIIGRHLFYKL